MKRYTIKNSHLYLLPLRLQERTSEYGARLQSSSGRRATSVSSERLLKVGRLLYIITSNRLSN